MGAVGHLWQRLRAPVHARRFTAAIARAQARGAGAGRRHRHGGRAVARKRSRRGRSASASCRCRTRSPRARRWSSTRRAGGSCIPATSSSTPARSWASRSIARYGRRSPMAACRRWSATPRTSSRRHPGRSESVVGPGDRAPCRRGRRHVRRDDLRVQRRAAQDAGRGRAGRGAVGLPARPGDAAHGRGRGRDRRADRLPLDHRPGGGERDPARQPDAARHRQPGRAARRLGAAQPRALSGPVAG